MPMPQPLISEQHVPLACPLAEWAGGPHGRDDVANSLAGCGGVSFVEKKRGVCGVDHNTVATVSGQGSQLVLRRQPGAVMFAAGRDDDERLAGQVNKRCGLLHRRRPLAELVDVASDIAGACAPGARLVTGA